MVDHAHVDTLTQGVLKAHLCVRETSLHRQQKNKPQGTLIHAAAFFIRKAQRGHVDIFIHNLCKLQHRAARQRAQRGVQRIRGERGNQFADGCGLVKCAFRTIDGDFHALISCACAIFRAHCRCLVAT